jgi:hypothetical protein
MTAMSSKERVALARAGVTMHAPQSERTLAAPRRTLGSPALASVVLGLTDQGIPGFLGAASSGSQPGTLLAGLVQDYFQSDAPDTPPADGGGHSVFVAKAAPPPFLDTGGYVTSPGLYACGASVFLATPPTTPGLYITVVCWDNVVELVAADGLVASTINEVSFEEVLGLSAADLPYQAQLRFEMPTDATLAISVFPFIQLLAVATP